MLRALHLDPDAVLGGDAQSYEDRFRLLQDVADALHAAAQPSGLVVILEDLHWADEPSLRVLRHLADQWGDARLLVLVRDTEPADDLRRVRNRPGAHRSDGSALALAAAESDVESQRHSPARPGTGHRTLQPGVSSNIGENVGSPRHRTPARWRSRPAR